MQWSFKLLSKSLHACYMPCLIQLFFENFQREIRNSIEIFRKVIELDQT